MLVVADLMVRDAPGEARALFDDLMASIETNDAGKKWTSQIGKLRHEAKTPLKFPHFVGTAAEVADQLIEAKSRYDVTGVLFRLPVWSAQEVLRLAPVSRFWKPRAFGGIRRRAAIPGRDPVAVGIAPMCAVRLYAESSRKIQNSRMSGKGVMDIRFDGRVALVSGGAQGIGQAMAVAFRDSGARVHLVDRDPNVLEIGRALQAAAHVVDLSERAAATQLVRTIVTGRGIWTFLPSRQAVLRVLLACHSRRLRRRIGIGFPARTSRARFGLRRPPRRS